MGQHGQNLGQGHDEEDAFIVHVSLDLGRADQERGMERQTNSLSVGGLRHGQEDSLDF